MKSAKISLWPLIGALVVGLTLPIPASALRVNIQSGGDADTLTFSFDSGVLPKYTVHRDGKRSLVVSLPADVWNGETRPGNRDFSGKVVRSIKVGDNAVEIATRTDGFGFIRVPATGRPQFVLQVYRDPIGARWEPPASRPAVTRPSAARTVANLAPAAQTAAAPAAQTAAPAAKAVAAPARARAAETVASAAGPQSQPASIPPVAQPMARAEADARPESNLPPEQGGADARKPFFSVPYSVRSTVAPPPGQAQAPASQVPAAQPEAASMTNARKTEAASPVTAVPAAASPVPVPNPAQLAAVASGGGESAPVAASGAYPPSSELRFKAVNKTAEQVKFAELAGPDADGGAARPVVEPATGADGAASMRGGVAGNATSPMATPSAQPDQAQRPVVQPVPQPAAQAGGTVSGSATPPSGAVAAAVPDQGISGAGQVGGGVVPPPSVVHGAPPPAPTAAEAARVELPAAPPPAPVAPPSSADAGQGNGTETALAENGTGTEAAASGADTAADNATRTAEAAREELKNQIYEAQTLMFNGNLPEALEDYEKVLKSPYLDDAMREESLYAVADLKKQINNDNPAEKFDEVSQAYLSAMNANLRSDRVPHALLNLGLLNLKVGNFPEAKAYFKLLQDKYPDDNNIPSISYYWGEYYYRKGDYKKAADQFQYLIQTYPEHELVKRAAYYLADSLEKTGFYDQAYQIMDYIDKRWPDYYMENPEFLRLAGGVEMRLGKWDAAKNHYFTFYNLNPEAKGADVVLAKIGDIYIREGRKQAARQIYEKAVKDYPTAEGGLVAKMRLAEEGVYDDPTLPQMGDVFNRPYNKRPEVVYQEIVKQYPDSPLAPIAQLKLAMWYAFNKKYPEALAAAQDLIEKYPDNPLADRARKLGDAVFALAVPGMVAEERYGRVVRYWENYNFIGQKKTRVNDRTKLGVAMSYWKVGQPEKAIALLKPYLQPRQIPGVSDEALGMAVNIYLDGLAWNEIDDLVGMARKHWKLDDKLLRRLDYARAMSLQNLGDGKAALPLWAALAKDAKVDPALRAYAMYYMAKSAMEHQDLRRVFVYSQEALTLLLQTDGDPEKIKDVVLMSIYATERSGRYGEALKWAKEYDRYIKPDNPEWASTRFKLARIYRKAGAMDEWKRLLTDIIEKQPDSLQAALAKSELETHALEEQAQQYAPAPQ